MGRDDGKKKLEIAQEGMREGRGGTGIEGIDGKKKRKGMGGNEERRD